MALLVLIFSVWLIPEFFGKPEPMPELVRLKADAAGQGLADQGQVVKTFRLFSFDPNALADSGWAELGLRERTISTIRKYLSRGGMFREPADLLKIYGLRKDEAERLMPYVRIQKVQPKRNASVGYMRQAWRQDGQAGAARSFYASMPARPWASRTENHPARRIMDINTADSADFERLPGIGPTLAARIIRFRNACGGFYSVNQVSEIYGISDTLFLAIRPRLILSEPEVRKVNINDWDEDSLARHPYIQRHEARAIAKFRKQHGRFQTEEDLLKLTMITPAWLDKMRNYLSFE